MRFLDVVNNIQRKQRKDETNQGGDMFEDYRML